jgi:hypothetical protein
VALVRSDVSEELSTSIIRATRIGEIGTTLAVTNNRRLCVFPSVRRLLVAANVVPSSPILVALIMDVTRRNIPEDVILCWMKLRNLHSAPNILTVPEEEDEIGGECSTYWEDKNWYRIFMCKS